METGQNMKKQLRRSSEVNPGKEKVWNVLVDDKFTWAWYSEFSEGAKAETDASPTE